MKRIFIKHHVTEKQSFFKLLVDAIFKRRLMLLALVFIIIALPIVYLTLKYQSPTQAAWFDDTWAFRKAISIPSHTTTESNVYVTVPSFDATDTSKFQSDCGDLRFTKQNGQTLPYYVVDCDATATIHVLFDTLPSGATTYYMYYGNPSAPNGFSAADFSSAATNLGTQTLANEEKSVGPVAYWKFDEGNGSQAYDSTANANNGSLGTSSSAPTWKTEDMCVSGKCLDFDGSNDNIGLSSGSNANITGDISVSVWINPKSPASAGVIFHKESQYTLVMRADKRVAWADSSNYSYAGFGDQDIGIELNKWNLITVTKTAGIVKIYLNGVEKVSKSFGSAITATNNILRFGCYAGASSCSASYFKGSIDEPKIYNYARTAAQVKADYNSRGFASVKGTSVGMGSDSRSLVSSDGLVGYWKMDEASWSGAAGEVLDASGNGNNGQAVSGATTASGKFGNGGSFDAVNDYVAFSSNIQLTGPFTTSFWMKTASAGSVARWRTIISFSNGAGDGIFIKTGQTYLYFENVTGTKDFTQTTVTDTYWHHIVFTRDVNDVIRGYVDGILDPNAPTRSGTISIDKLSDERSNEYFGAGFLDETRIYNRALSPKEVRDLYAWAPGPVGYWDMNIGIGSTAPDISGNGNNGNWNGTGSRWATGKYGMAGSFNGSNDYISISANSSINFNQANAFSINAWVKTNTVSSGVAQTIVEKHENVTNEFLYALTLNNSNPAKFEFTVAKQNVSAITKTATNAALANTWYHVVGVSDGTQIFLYINGVQDGSPASITFSSATQSVASLYFGRQYNNANFFNGQIDDVRIYNYARSSKQIVEDMNGGHPAGGSPVGSQVGYWRFDEGQGSTVNNAGIGGISLNGNLGVGNSAPLWSNSGKFDKALSFDGSNDYAEIPDNANLDITGELTFSYWVKLISTQNINYGGVSKYANMTGYSNQRAYGCWFILDSTQPSCTISDDGTANANHYTSVSSANNIGTNAWTHIVLTYKPSSFLRLYVNGKLDTETTSGVVGSIYNSSAPLWIGTNYDKTVAARFMTGSIDEVKVYNYALTEDEIKLDYNRGSALVLGSTGSNTTYEKNAANQEYCVPGDAASCTAPVAEWKFDENTGTSAKDTSGNGNTGTLGVGSSAPTWTLGKTGSALSFDGSNDYVRNTSNIIPSGNFTYNLWFKTKDPTITQAIFNLRGTEAAGTYIGTRIVASKLVTYIDGSAALTGTTTLLSNTWYFLSVNYDAARTPKTIITLNSIQDATGTAAAVYTYDQMLIGSRTTTTLPFNGLIDQVKIYDYARTPAQVTYDYNRGAPVGHWRMDECQGGTTYDSSGYANNGIITIGATGSQNIIGTCNLGVGSSSPWGNGATGKYSSSLNFDGTDDFISVSGTTGLITGANTRTLSAWIKPTSTSSRGMIVTYGDNSDDQKWDFEINGWHANLNGKLIVHIWNAGIATATIPIIINQWNHVVVSYRGGTLQSGVRFFVNGVEQTTQDAGNGTTHSWTSTPNTTATNLQIGRRSTDNAGPFPGQIDDVKIFNYALSAEQIKTLYNSGSAIQFAPVTGSP